MDWTPRIIRPPATRRAQTLAFLGGAGAIVAIIAGLFMLLMSRSAPDRYDALRGQVNDMLSPVWMAVRLPLAGANVAIDWVSDYFGAIERNRQLEAQLARYHRLREVHARTHLENRQLRALLAVPATPHVRVGVFAISGATSGGMVRSAIINGGKRHGVMPGQPARTADGLVGRVIETGQSAARVLMLTDAASRVPVINRRTGRPAMATGIGTPHLEIRFIAPTDADFVPGDLLVTSGDGGIYPPGIPVARITGFRRDIPLARPVARMNALGFIIIEQPYLPPAMLTAPAIMTPAPADGAQAALPAPEQPAP